MSKNKDTILRYIDGFNRSDHGHILSCLTDDVEWIMPGLFHHVGKDAFDKEIDNEAFTGKPVITITRLTEEEDIVIAEGKVIATKKEGMMPMHLVFCDVFEMREGKIKKLIGFIAEEKKA